MYNEYVIVDVGVSFTTKLCIPKSSLPNGDIEFVESAIESEIVSEFGDLDNLEIDWIDIF